MSNTLKFGNGEWYGKKDTILAYNDLNSNFKPLPFSFDRASSATVVNKAGLIETVGSGEPRIDYTDSAKGALLLEPARTNSFTYSEDFSDGSWQKSQATVTITNEISPNGNTNNVYNYVGNNSNVYTTSQAANIEYTISCYVKSNGQGKDTFTLRLGNERSVVFTATSEWKKYSFTNTPTTNVFSISSNALLDANVLIWGAQLEQGSYATSYIPTSGGVVTRVADACNNGANEQVINSTEGVLYVETSKINESEGEGTIALSRDSNNEIRLNFATNNRLNVFVNVLGDNQVYMDNADYNLEEYNKIAIKYKLNDYSVFVNGSKIHTDTDATVPSGLNLVDFNQGTSSNKFYGNTKDVRVYNTALTDQELINLTTI